MKQPVIKKLTGIISLLVCFSNSLVSQNNSNTSEQLSAKEQSIVAIAALAGKGDLKPLHTAINESLNAGCTINELKEVMVHVYAYAGFPRSLNALTTLKAVVDERKLKGLNDVPGKEPSVVRNNKTKLKAGTELQTKLLGRAMKTSIADFTPIIDVFLKEHLFWDIFSRDNLDFKTRELVTIATLAALGNVEAQLRSHFNVGMYNGLTEPQLIQLVSIIHNKIGATEGNKANVVLQNVLGKKITETSAGAQKADTIFSTGQKITNNNFTGTAYLHQMVTTDSINKVQVGNVTFEPGARSNWHYHPDGQILLITGGTGYYQEKGSPKRIIRKGDVVNCPPNIPHWHGASANEGLIQIAITHTGKGTVVWLQPVTDEEYNQ